MEPSYGGTTQASDWGERDETMERLRQIAALVNGLPCDGSRRVDLYGSEATWVLTSLGGKTREHIYTPDPGLTISAAELVVDGVVFHSQHTRPSTQTEIDAHESRSKA